MGKVVAIGFAARGSSRGSVRFGSVQLAGGGGWDILAMHADLPRELTSRTFVGDCERLLDKVSLDLMSANGRTPMAKTLKNSGLVFW